MPLPKQTQFEERRSHAEQIGSSLRNGWLVVLIVVGISALGMVGYSMHTPVPPRKTKLVCPEGTILVRMDGPVRSSGLSPFCITGSIPREVPDE